MATSPHCHGYLGTTCNCQCVSLTDNTQSIPHKQKTSFSVWGKEKKKMGEEERDMLVKENERRKEKQGEEKNRRWERRRET